MLSYKKKPGSRQIATDGKIPIYLYQNEIKRSRLQTKDAFPTVDPKSDRILVSGPSGAGKSTWVGEYGRRYKKKFPKRPVYVISSVSKDASLDKLKPIRIDMDAFSDPEMELDPEETFTESMVIFDDVDTICDNALRKDVLALRDFMLEQSRHYDTHLICTTHILMNGASTRRLLNEGSKYVVFPNSNAYQISNFLKRYIGLQSGSIDKFLNSDRESRWKMISRDYPLYVLSRHEIYAV
jgi:predicted AAA+ superfamily ATPase